MRKGRLLFVKTLAEKLKLTAGQQYFWGVEVVSPSGTVVARDWRVFKTEAYRDASQPFSSVTLLTHGFQLAPTAPVNVAESIAALRRNGREHRPCRRRGRRRAIPEDDRPLAGLL
jgi:hypothetical protein